MVWYKSWLESRIKLLATLALVTFILLMFSAKRSHGGMGVILSITPFFNIYMVWICAFLAGAGIATQPGFQATKGIHGSTLFTLSLPVSRLRLLTVRAGIGWLECVLSVGIFCGGLWLLVPVFREAGTGTAMLEYSATLIACATALYFFSVLLATFLDDMWRIWGTLCAPFVLEWLAGHVKLPAFADVFRAIGKGSPLITRTAPWATIAFCLGLAATFFLASVKVAQAREYQ